MAKPTKKQIQDLAFKGRGGSTMFGVHQTIHQQITKALEV